MKIIVANLKMNLLASDIEEYKEKIEGVTTSNKVIVCPSMLYVPLFKSDKYVLGAQNCYVENKGSYTGEVSPMQLSSCGVEYVIIGHSERRNYFKETDEFINRKNLAVIKNQMKLIFCVGESREEREKGKTYDVIERQLKEGLDRIDNVSGIIIAYEPMWSIGTGLVPTMEEISEVTNYIKGYIRNRNSQEIKVLYGGSVDLNNASEIGAIEAVDGMLIGSASVRIDNFVEIIKKLG